jgi:(4S)-4-hydroxy-5-phosphonooxypentane-2,3-dione isomerase
MKTEMIVICVHIKVLPEKLQSFIQATIENHLESVKEPGNIRFDLIQKSDDPCSFMIYEAYVSDDEAAAHKNTPHYLKWRDLVKDFMAEPRVGIKYNIIAPTETSR